MEHKLDPNSSDCDPKHERKSDTSNSTQSDLRNATPIKQQPQINTKAEGNIITKETKSQSVKIGEICDYLNSQKA
ncbi:hypothetical protein DY000_02013457 [Brassica cretica]|uniref:Uncharacterized protein n=1 Tax=Brassica cretica TaxID=69181 RepID=A0ABQ7CYD5_BRACR|nr:hypothetical protein DY000_02013457 [Brassica cretica]